MISYETRVVRPISSHQKNDKTQLPINLILNDEIKKKINSKKGLEQKKIAIKRMRTNFNIKIK